MATPTPPPALTLGAVEGAALATIAAEGAYILAQTTQGNPLSYLAMLGVGLVTFAGWLGYKAYKA